MEQSVMKEKHSFSIKMRDVVLIPFNRLPKQNKTTSIKSSYLILLYGNRRTEGAVI